MEAGKKAAATVLDLQSKLMQKLLGDEPRKPEELAEAIGHPDRTETVLHLLEHLAANKRITRKGGAYASA